MTTLLQTRVKTKIAREFEQAARRRGFSTDAFLQKVVTEIATTLDKDISCASLELSREGFTLPEWPGKTERQKIKSAVRRRHVSR